MSRVIVLNDTLTFSTSTGDQRKQTEGVREEQRKNKWEEDREGKKERARDEGRCLRDTRGKEHNIHIRDVWPLESELKRETAVDVLIYTLAFAHKRRQGARLNDYFDTGSEGMREQMTCTSAKQTHSRERAGPIKRFPENTQTYAESKMHARKADETISRFLFISFTHT